jgi:hypothetical protein
MNGRNEEKNELIQEMMAEGRRIVFSNRGDLYSVIPRLPEIINKFTQPPFHRPAKTPIMPIGAGPYQAVF